MNIRVNIIISGILLFSIHAGEGFVLFEIEINIIETGDQIIL
jgi:hypothetical protein